MQYLICINDFLFYYYYYLQQRRMDQSIPTTSIGLNDANDSIHIWTKKYGLYSWKFKTNKIKLKKKLELLIKTS